MTAHRASKEARERDKYRKRYRRQAERYLKKAENASGQEAARYRFAARESLLNAARTYDNTSKITGRVRQLLDDLGMQDVQAGDFTDFERAQARRGSERAMASNETATTMSDALISGPLGHRIFGAFSQAWEGEEGSREDAIIRYMQQRFPNDNITTMRDVLERVEQVAPGLYEDIDNADDDPRYNAVKAAILDAFF